MKNENVRQGIHFDLDTKALEKYYTSDSWRNAYEVVRNFFKQNEIEHEQGSGYHSKNPMSRFDVINIIDAMIIQYPWLSKCVRVCTIADVPVAYDITHMFDNNVDIPTREELKLLNKSSKSKIKS